MEEVVLHTILNPDTTFRYEERKYHVVSHLFDNGRIIYVLKFYKQWWRYEAWDAQEFDFRMGLELIKNLKRK